VFTVIHGCFTPRYTWIA